MAKHLCMLERNELGKVARTYFIECEKKLRQAIPSRLLTTEEMIILQAQSVIEVKVQVEEHERLFYEQQHKLLECETRINIFDGVNIDGTTRQRLNLMVRKLAFYGGVSFASAWEIFIQAFNTAYRTNVKLAMNYWKLKQGRNTTLPEYLEEVGRIDDALRVADKLLNATDVGVPPSSRLEYHIEKV